MRTASIGVGVSSGAVTKTPLARSRVSHNARETSIIVDSERFVPIEEQTGGTTVRYSDWREVEPGKWVPGIELTWLHGSVHFRMNFAWLGTTRSGCCETPNRSRPRRRIRALSRGM